jgi:predicted membrane channel-forming protein YqfA (hemolysin III family)
MWSALLGVVLTLAFAAHAAAAVPLLLAPLGASASAPSAAPIAVYLAAALFAFAGSATFHTLSCLGLSWSNFLIQIDYLGIGVLISGASIAPAYYGHRCTPALAWAVASQMCAAPRIVFRLQSPGGPHQLLGQCGQGLPRG